MSAVDVYGVIKYVFADMFQVVRLAGKLLYRQRCSLKNCKDLLQKIRRGFVKLIIYLQVGALNLVYGLENAGEF